MRRSMLCWINLLPLRPILKKFFICWANFRKEKTECPLNPAHMFFAEVDAVGST